jgi:two-component system phosphate regulon sensor histidine kinase PhoR
VDQLFETQTEATLLAAVAAALPDATLAVGRDFRLVCANMAARSIFPGMRDGEPISRALRAPEILDAIQNTLSDGRSVETTWLERVPVERQFDVHVASLGAALKGGGVLVSLHDKTEARRVERMRADFVANASHELRTPLASLLGFVETLQGPARSDPAAQQRFLAIMGEQARRMSRLIDDLLSLSRIEQTLHVRPDSQVDLTSIASQMADALAPMAQDSEATIQVESDVPVYVLGERDELLRVTENLVENAIKYGGPGEVTVCVRTENSWGVIDVIDRGPGIAPEHIPRLTERFYRVDPGDSRAKGGTGLGLAIVKHIVARHRGRLTVESGPDKGTRFSVYLPQ